MSKIETKNKDKRKPGEIWPGVKHRDWQAPPAWGPGIVWARYRHGLDMLEIIKYPNGMSIKRVAKKNNEPING